MTSNQSKQMAEIATQMIARYSERYNNLGYSVHTLGWGSKEQQTYRFAQSLSLIDFSPEKSILDIGCGFGDYLALITAQEKSYKNYYGWDINPDLINEAKRIWGDNKNVAFSVMNLGMMDSFKEVADIGVMFGVLNLNLGDKMDNYEYSFKMIRNAFECVKEVLVVDFLSNRFTPDYAPESFVFYHDPARVLDFALSLSPNVVIKHNYSPIPQKEFMLFIYK